MRDFLTWLIPGGGALTIIIWLLERPEHYDRIKAVLFQPFLSGRKTIQKVFISSDIQTKLTSFSRHLAKDMDEKDVCQAKIKWVDTTTPEAFFQDGRLIIRMDCSENKNRNLTLATLLFVQQAVLRKTKRYLDVILRDSIDLVVTKKLFDAKGGEDEQHYYNDIFLTPKLCNSPELRGRCEELALLDEKGLFTRLLLRELRFLGEQLDNALPTDEIRDEIGRFSDYLCRISRAPSIHADGDRLRPSDFQFKGRYLRIQVVLFAIYANVMAEHVRPYMRRVKDGLKDRIDIFYVLAHEASFPLLALFDKDIKHRLVRQKILVKTNDHTFRLKRSHREYTKYKCLIYRRVESLSDEDVDLIFEDLPGIDEEQEEFIPENS